MWRVGRSKIHGEEMFINHCHVYPEGIIDKHKPNIGTIKCLKQWMQKLGIEKAIVFALFEPFKRILPNSHPNEWLLENLKEEKNLFGFSTINPLGKNAAEALKKYTEQGFLGAKIHPPEMRVKIDDARAEPFYEMAEKLEIPLLFHTGVHGWKLKKYLPILLDEVAQNHPKLPIIIEHCGGGPFFNQALAVLQNNQNCYAGIAQVRKALYRLSPEQISILLKSIGPTRIIYGADYPHYDFEDIKKDIKMVLNWKISTDEKEKILGGNMSNLVEK